MPMLEVSSAHPVALLLGSGFSRLAGMVKTVRRIPYAQIEGVADGGAGPRMAEATRGTIDGKPVLVYPSRFHVYQGYTANEVASLVRHAHAQGCRVAIFVGASGAIGEEPGSGLALLRDHLNLTGKSPLVGWEHEGDSFVPMQGVYDEELRACAHEVAKECGIPLSEGVYAEVCGPHLETPAEVRALKGLGADYVGMSLALEATMAHALNMRILAITLATNPAGAPGTSHESVRIEATSCASDLEKLVRGVLRHL